VCIRQGDRVPAQRRGAAAAVLRKTSVRWNRWSDDRWGDHSSQKIERGSALRSENLATGCAPAEIAWHSAAAAQWEGEQMRNILCVILPVMMFGAACAVDEEMEEGAGAASQALSTGEAASELSDDEVSELLDDTTAVHRYRWICRAVRRCRTWDDDCHGSRSYTGRGPDRESAARRAMSQCYRDSYNRRNCQLGRCYRERWDGGWGGDDDWGHGDDDWGHGDDGWGHGGDDWGHGGDDWGHGGGSWPPGGIH
jgi:hypothetical protein